VKLEWERPGIVRMTARVEELAALVAGSRIAERALASSPDGGAAVAGLDRVLAGFDRASRALRARTPEGTSS